MVVPAFVALLLWPFLTEAGHPYCLPGDNCFPDAAALQAFNISIGGRLLEPTPYAAVCYSGKLFDASACSTLVENQTNRDFRHQIPAALMYTNWELISGTNAGCVTPNTVPSQPLNGSCTLGSLSQYMVNASSANDVSLAVTFAAKHNLRLRIKNSGHDYTGRSTEAGAFTIWTYHLNSTSFDASFVPDSCRSAPQAVIVAGPAVDVQTLYTAAAQVNRITIGGFTPTVGAAGGYIIGGGTGPIGPHYGLGVDNALQYQVVMADGQIQIANACQNTDLFWALRGGGGTFGVTTKVWIKAHPAFNAVNVITGVLTANSTATYATALGAFIDLHPTLREQGLDGIWETSSPSIVVCLSQPFVNTTPTTAEQALKILANVSSIPGVTSTLQSAQFPTWLDAYTQAIVPTINPGSAVGIDLLDTSRILSNAFMNDPASRKNLTQFILDIPNGIPFIYQSVGGGAVNQPAPDATAVHPAWRDAFGFMDVPVFGVNTGVTSAQNATYQSIAAAADKAFYSGGKAIRAAYYNEAAMDLIEWQDLFWGSNYARLLQIKRGLDPMHVFNCRQCVGSEDGF